MSGSRSAALALAASVLALALPSSASALKLAPCRTQEGFACGTLRVPLDHRGKTRGSIGLAVAVQRRRPRGAGLMIALSGGPGQGSVSGAASFALSLGPVLRRYRLVVLDQRGTGASGALSCPKVQALGALDPFTPGVIRDCALRIGARRAFYRTADTVADLDALRRAFGVEKVALMGISYGTWVAQEYARTYPERTDSLILDSIVGPQPPDAFFLDTYRRLPRILREQCARRRCRGVTSDPVGDLGAVAKRLRSGPIRGSVYTADGRRRAASYTSEEQLSFLVTSTDLNPFMQARMPGALAAAGRGDPAALLRLRRIGEGPPTTTKELSFGLNVVTSCQDAELPFGLDTDVSARPALVAAQLAAIPPADYAPWSAAVVRSSSYADDCLDFPRDDRPRSVLGPLPDVRALLLSGRLDMRTPVENGREVAALLPQASVVEVPGNGHDQVDSDATGCVEAALRRWTARRSVGTPCRGKSNQVSPIERPPLKLSEFRAPSGARGDRGRTVLAALETAAEVRFSALEAVFAGFRPRGGGLRSGSFAADDAFSGTIRLRDYSYVPGVRLSGTLDVNGGFLSGRVTVRGRFSGGLTITSSSTASGMLGGRAVRVARGAVAAASSSGPGPSDFAVPAALLRPRGAERALSARAGR